MLDALVIGGGPAGATAALLLARAGLRVAVLERAPFPRGKVCGEYVGAAGLEALARIDPALAAALPRSAPLRRLALWAGDGACEAPLPAPHARAIGREALDAGLLAAARAHGALVHQPMSAFRIERTARGFRCSARERNGAREARLEARVVIAAHGSPQGGALLAFKARFRAARVPPGLIALAPLPGGYGGAVGLADGSATYACCVRREALAAIRAAAPGACAGEAVLRAALAHSDALRSALEGGERAGPWLATGALRPGARPLCRDGVFAIGAAAGEVHPLVGKGISIAVESAEALCAALTPTLRAGYPAGSERIVARAYEEAWRGLFRARHAWSARFARLAGHPAGARAAQALAARVPGVLAVAARFAA